MIGEFSYVFRVQTVQSARIQVYMVQEEQDDLLPCRAES